MNSQQNSILAQGLKPNICCYPGGTAKAVPCQITGYETGSSLFCPQCAYLKDAEYEGWATRKMQRVSSAYGVTCSATGNPVENKDFC